MSRVICAALFFIGFCALVLETPDAIAAPKPGDKFDDWIITCAQKAEKADARSCMARQVQVTESQGKDKQKVRLIDARFGFSGPKEVLNFVAWLPLGISIQSGVTIKFDNGTSVAAALQACTRYGCLIENTVDGKFWEALRAGKNLQVIFTMKANPKPTTLTLSTKGLEKAINSLK